MLSALPVAGISCRGGSARGMIAASPSTAKESKLQKKRMVNISTRLSKNGSTIELAIEIKVIDRQVPALQ